MVDTEIHDRIKVTNVESILELRHLCLKKSNNFHASLLPIKELHVVSSPAAMLIIRLNAGCSNA
jgi:hypothetical protein